MCIPSTKFTEEEWDNWEEESEEVMEKEVSSTNQQTQIVANRVTDLSKKTALDFDISKLDIKCSGSSAKETSVAESDFFADMAPVISAAPCFDIENLVPPKPSKFDVQIHDEEANQEGWGDWD
jgi:hypothetical protein